MNDKYLRTKKFFAKLLGIAVLVVSFQFSAAGFGFRNPDAEWVGWVLAIAVTVAQLIFNTRVKDLNWTIVVMGLMSYLYSIYTNISGFYVYTGNEFAWNFTAIIPVLSGCFMDIFPEMALAWGFDASTEGDMIGNIVELSGGKNINPEIKERLPKSLNRNIQISDRDMSMLDNGFTPLSPVPPKIPYRPLGKFKKR